MTRILHFSLGPVQGFIGSARRTRDLWAGSFLLSWLTGHAMAEVHRAKRTIAIPAVYGPGGGTDIADHTLAAILNPPKRWCVPLTGTLPNHFRAELPDGFEPKQCRRAVRTAWRNLSKAVFDVFVEPVARNCTEAKNVQAIWERQIDTHARRTALTLAKTGAAFSARLLTPLAIGLGNPHPKENGGMTWHHTLGVPYLPGSGLKQVAVEMARSGWSSQPYTRSDADDELDRLFGSEEEGTGSVIVFDGLPAGQVTVTSSVTTSHYKPYYEEEPSTQRPKAPGDWFKPNPVTFPVVAPGALFYFAVVPRRRNAAGAAADLRRALFWLMEGLEIQGAGAKTIADGLGRFAVESKPTR